MAVDPNGAIKGFDILDYKPICVLVVDNRKAVKPLPFNQGMEGFYAGIARVCGERKGVNGFIELSDLLEEDKFRNILV